VNVKKPMVYFLFCFLWAFLLMLVSAGSSGELTDGQKLNRINELYEKYKRSFPDVPDVSVEELIALRREQDVVLVDRREKREQRVSMLPGAIPSGEFEKNIENYKDKTIVVYCTIGSRSGYYARELIQKGFAAYNLRGGILAWIHAGQQLVSEGKETRRVHVYGRRWDLAPKGYEAVW
jgi:rhodanese-related sulfurtransferase